MKNIKEIDLLDKIEAICNDQLGEINERKSDGNMTEYDLGRRRAYSRVLGILEHGKE